MAGSTNYRRVIASLKDSRLEGFAGIVDRAVREGFSIPGSTLLTAAEALYDAMVSSGYFAKRDLILIGAYNDATFKNFSRINWKKPYGKLFDFVGDYGYNETGYFGTSDVDDYGETNWNILNDSETYTLNDASRDCVVYETSNSQAISGIKSGAEERWATVNAIANLRINQGGSNLSGGSVNLTGAGYKAINRTSSTEVIFFNKATQTDRNATSTNLIDDTIVLGRVLSTTSSDLKLSFFSTGASVVSEGQSFRSAFNTYLDAIGLSQVA